MVSLTKVLQRKSQKFLSVGLFRTYSLLIDCNDPDKKFRRFRALAASVEPRPAMSGLELAIEVVVLVGFGAFGAAPATGSRSMWKFVKKPPNGVLPCVVLLDARISPPNFMVCLPLVQLSE